MTSRERVLRAYNHKEPDRVPICIGGVAQKLSKKAYYAVKEHIGIRDVYEKESIVDELDNVVYYHPGFLEYFRTDFREVHIRRLPPVKRFEDGSWEHELGIRMKHSSNGETVNFVSHPLREADIPAIERYPLPDPEDPRRFAGLAEEARSLVEDTSFAVGCYKATLLGIFDCAWVLRSLDQFLMDLALDPPLAEALLAKTFEFNYRVYARLLDEVGKYVHVVEFNDDLGTQDNLMIAPDAYRRFLKPLHRRMVEMFRAKAPQAKVLLHCCGNIYKILPDLIEVGIDVINPVQPLAADMDTWRLKREFGKDLCFQGGIDIQRAMKGTAADVEREVSERIRSLAPGGGYVLSTANNIASDIPVENVVSLYKLADRLGTYPIGA
jgi:uroporphyrinogen decarboxylase